MACTAFHAPYEDSQASGETAHHAFHTRHAPMALILSHFLQFSLTTKNSLPFPAISCHLLQIHCKIGPPTRTRIAQIMQQSDKFGSQTDEFGRNLSLFRRPNLRQPGSPFVATRDSAVASDCHLLLPPQTTTPQGLRTSTSPKDAQKSDCEIPSL